MITITFSEEIDLGKSHFKSVEEFQNYLLELKQESAISDEHKSILDNRLKDEKLNPEAYLTVEELKKGIKRQ